MLNPKNGLEVATNMTRVCFDSPLHSLNLKNIWIYAPPLIVGSKNTNSLFSQETIPMLWELFFQNRYIVSSIVFRWKLNLKLKSIRSTSAITK